MKELIEKLKSDKMTTVESRPEEFKNVKVIGYKYNGNVVFSVNDAITYEAPFKDILELTAAIFDYTNSSYEPLYDIDDKFEEMKNGIYRI